MTLRTLNYGNYGIFLIMRNAGFLSINSRTVQGHANRQHHPAPEVAQAQTVRLATNLLRRFRFREGGFPLGLRCRHMYCSFKVHVFFCGRGCGEKRCIERVLVGSTECLGRFGLTANELHAGLQGI